MEYPARPSNPFRVDTLAPALVALLLVAALQPLVVIATTVAPYQVDDATWRIRFFALILGTAPQLAVSLVVIAAVGLFSERYVAVRLAAWGALALGIVLVPILILDGLDAVQLQELISLDQLRRFRINAIQTWLMGALMVPVLVWVGLRGLKAGKREPRLDISDALLLDKEPLPGPYDPRVTN